MKRILFALCALLFMSTTAFAANDTITSPECGFFRTDSVCTEFTATDTVVEDSSTVLVYNWYINFDSVLTGSTYSLVPNTSSRIEIDTIIRDTLTASETIPWEGTDSMTITIDQDTAYIEFKGLWWTDMTDSILVDIKMECTKEQEPTGFDNTMGTGKDFRAVSTANMEITIYGCGSAEFITIYDMSGKAIKSIRPRDDNSIVIRGLDPGVYVASDQNGGTVKFTVTPR